MDIRAIWTENSCRDGISGCLLGSTITGPEPKNLVNRHLLVASCQSGQIPTFNQNTSSQYYFKTGYQFSKTTTEKSKQSFARLNLLVSSTKISVHFLFQPINVYWELMLNSHSVMNKIDEFLHTPIAFVLEAGERMWVSPAGVWN